MRIVLYHQAGMEIVLGTAPDCETGLVNPPSCVDMTLPFACFDITDQFIALHDQLQIDRTKRALEVPARDEWSPWIKWRGGEFPIPWAKADDWGYMPRYCSGIGIVANVDAAQMFWKFYFSDIITAYRYRLAAAPKDWVPPQ